MASTPAYVPAQTAYGVKVAKSTNASFSATRQAVVEDGIIAYSRADIRRRSSCDVRSARHEIWLKQDDGGGENRTRVSIPPGEAGKTSVDGGGR
jgi:hypothetical protein